MNAIQISNVAIRQISDTLYNLTDLHKAAGGENKHRPTFWMQNIQTQDLIAEIEAEGGQAFQTAKGKNGGTYVCKELVIAYGMWISPTFALKVIRCFLEAQGQVSDGLPAKTTDDDRIPLQQAVAALVGCRGIDYSTTYGMVHQRFNVSAIEDLLSEQLPEGIAYVHALTLHAGLTGEALDTDPVPRDKAFMPDSEIADGIACLLAQSYRACSFLKRYLPAFRRHELNAGREMCGFAYDAAASRDAVNRWMHANQAALSRRTSALLPELAASYEEGGVRYPLVWAR